MARTPQTSIKQNDPNNKYREVMSAGTLTGDSVRNPAGESLGKIEDIMIDVPTGRVAYAVLSFGGFLGLGDRLFAVPWSSFTLDEDEKCFILDADKARLEKAPGFDKDNWPDMADVAWRDQVYNYYGAEPYWNREQKTFRGGGGL